ncbi:phosphoribosyl-ATP diphosphatase [Bradyrhizobium erythrophlei]|jgi:phosphoribosyl-ATP pyrophosphohydrolase|uniref:phosphoribosyl-ATP diphosphatase n=1 Tax=Bradyrhizobium erythrophlei TaxID=1437360 RepID=A0A1M5PUB7_9BRAD|nr:phosphoribosyl-ATP diphosphatase [Bradyrhizobium erythrophlei]SHH04843.1 phosphoribosyl-ATP pyrophosphatase [Bradyrhizobium erythrophlei]
MTDAAKLSDLKYPDLQGDGSRRSQTRRHSGGPRRTRAVRAQASESSPCETESPVAPDSLSAIAPPSLQPGELDRLYRSLAEVTRENHPRTARLLASSTRKTAQKVIEEAGEVALEAVKHRARGIVRESADLLYHLVALWHRASIDPDDVWTEMRYRAGALGIAEKRPKARSDHRRRPIQNVKPPAKTQQE